MADIAIASAITLPDELEDSTTHTNGLKRRMSAAPEGEEETDAQQAQKRQRISPGKNSPTATTSTPPTTYSAAPSDPVQSPASDRDNPREARRKSGVADEKQRSKRLFGALLGSLNQPKDRTAKRRLEIESRRKAELQRQDDERLEDRQRLQLRLASKRRDVRVKVDQENMHTRHRNMLDRARYLQTFAEPKIYYKPWDLRPDEEDRIEDQIRDAQAQIDKELDDLDEQRGQRRSPPNLRDSPQAIERNGASGTVSGAAVEDSVEEIESSRNIDTKGKTPDKSANSTALKPAEVPESPAADVTTNHSILEPDPPVDLEAQDGKDEVPEDDGVHVEGGDEDSVIY